MMDYKCKTLPCHAEARSILRLCYKRATIEARQGMFIIPNIAADQNVFQKLLSGGDSRCFVPQHDRQHDSQVVIYNFEVYHAKDFTKKISLLSADRFYK